MTEQEQTREIAELSRAIEPITKLAQDIKITNEPTLKQAIDVSGRIKNQIKDTEVKRQKLVKPLNDHVSWINAEFRKITEPLKELREKIDGSIDEYYHKLELIKQREQDRILKEAQKKYDKVSEKAEKKGIGIEPFVAPVLAPLANSIESGESKLVIKEVVDFEVVDEKIVPIKYRPIDLTLVRKDVRAGVKEIPGIKIFMRKQMTNYDR